MRTFAHFPRGGYRFAVCPICKTFDDKPCLLIPVDGTNDGSIVQAAPVHVECLDGFRFNREFNVIYLRTEP
jgi:hypothetical protein